MAIQAGHIIEIQHYNDLAFKINMLFSDISPGLNWNSAGLILNSTALLIGEAAGSTRNLTSVPAVGDYLVVLIDEITQPSSNYSINYNTGVITFQVPLPPNAALKVFNRTRHRYGWGQQASVYPANAGDLVRADETVFRSYIEANINNIIDKVNIIEDRIGGPNQLSRFNKGDLIKATDKTTIQNLIDNDILTGSNYWKNVLTTVSSSVQSFSRTSDWDNLLTGTWKYTWDSYDSFRYFFNSGCQLRLYIEIAGDDTTQAVWNWGQVATNMGSLILDYSTCSQTGINGISSNLGAYDLTTQWQTVFVSDGPTMPRDSYGGYDYVGTADIKIVWKARIQTTLSGQISLEISATLDDNDANTTFVGVVTFHAGYSVADDVIDNSATFSMSNNIPVINAVDTFNSGDDS